ncbi:hypothetical protein MPLB_1990079 [Mesorhizobium sp. ORS 3324]|uniref:Uncharacterized protein n=1 Tax=Mesorhizobium plurifarium TaxID=69974 RepID=A0A090GAP3_MESPL|nr:hypothetical protein MPLB_1990079 [Mesorhizobium sp. ORS 3324]CDX56021.1 hypothetical protein MPL3365_220015 [Mesorhizobium plurifarium]
MRLMVWVLQDQTPAQVHSPATASTMPNQAAAKPGNIPPNRSVLNALVGTDGVTRSGKARRNSCLLHVQSKNPSGSNLGIDPEREPERARNAARSHAS